ncbi:hypothetical protein E3G68_005174 [Mycobacteroides abscessus]|uniref:hypothetical protein n=1 Tax=Mycobacteroides abscessus TaxID=36809 RepID=UPI001878944F|nr:hypothetical protein [Mycobacteroides abscessus]
MFDRWVEGDYLTLFHVDRPVTVDITRVFPPPVARKDELPLGLKASGLWLEPHMIGRQIAWLRRADGEWLACVQMPASSANKRSKLLMTLWLPPHAFAVEAPKL